MKGETLKTVVLKIGDDIHERLCKYTEGDDKNIKFLIATAIRDYLSKREARTRRAERQKTAR